MSIQEPSAEPISIPSGHRNAAVAMESMLAVSFYACAKANRACTNCLPSKHGCCQNTSSELTASSNVPIDSTSSSQLLYQHTSQFSDSQQLPLLQLPSTSIGLHVFGSLKSPSHLAIGLELQCSHLEPNLTIGSISTSQPSSHISSISTDSQQRYQSTLFTFHFSAISIITTTISFGLLVVTTTPFSVSSIASYATTVVTSVPTPFSSISIANFFISITALPYTLLPPSQRLPPSSLLLLILSQPSSQLPSSQPVDHLAGMPAQHVALHQEELTHGPFQMSRQSSAP